MRAETRHQLKQDRFRGTTLQVAEGAATWTAEHKSKIIAGAVAAVIVVAVVAGGWYYLASQEQKASADLSKAMRTMETYVRPAGAPAQPEIPSFASAQERATEARKQFQAIVDKYPHTRSSEFAHYFLGIAASDLGDYATAQKELGPIASSRNQDLASLAKMAQASTYRKQGENKKAIEIYKTLADKPTALVSKANAQLQLASALMADRQPLEAKNLYERIQKENPASPASQIAAQALQDLK